MSINLNAMFDGKKESLWQTPSQISYMCVVQPDGSVPWELTGKKAKHALQIYLQWLLYSTNGQWSSKEASEEARQNVKEEMLRIQKLMDTCKRVRVWVM